ncbi:potassium-transporting ATPase subunit C [Rhodococcus sp. IEGM 248]|uniref:potassium-transporting ATPase subunit C n=1 Tax=Rhodococcus opacus TaxID=37919 RepID=UPI0013BEF19E|nr:potassium-transporting ATPase subunit C [Rhodococcus opacus]MDV7086007.1 potassium-transporting ATPase subunit C [Rhodococcus opacus]NDV05203.1 potassium-transporting ATPase subunit C [Rhodococcus sp. IEGM 248]
MRISSWIRQHLAALRALLVLTVITGIAYPLAVWAVASGPSLHEKAEGSIVEVNGQAVGSTLIGQLFTDADGNPLAQYFQSRPSAAGDGYDPTSTSASNLGPESIVDTPADPALIGAGMDSADAGFTASLLTTVCSRSQAVGQLAGVDWSRPFCTPGGVGAVLSVIGPRDSRGNVVHPTRVVSVNEPCSRDPAAPVTPFLGAYEGVQVECAEFGEDYAIGQIVPIRGNAPATPAVAADAVTASGSGLDPHISPAYADLQAARVANARAISVDQVRAVIAGNQDGRTLGFLGEPRVNVLELNIALDQKYPVRG